MTSLKKLYHEFPKKFWIVVGVHFIDKIGGTLVFPFFALYITRKFNVGMTEAGVHLGILALAGMVGSVVGGALTDRLGRRKLILFGLVSDVGGPAHGAMIADILSKEQRQEGFGILRVVGNIAWLVGPTVGGFVARTSFFALMPETKPEHHEGQTDEGFLQTFRNYGIVLRDRHGIQPQGSGFLLSASAITVICFQFWTMRVIKTRPQFLMMALGTMFYMIGFGMFGVVSAYWLFVLAVVIVTIGEMIVIPTSQALAASFARIDMRGRSYGGLRVMRERAGRDRARGGRHIRLGAQPRFAPAATRAGTTPMVMEAEHG